MRVAAVGFTPVKGMRHASYDAVLLGEHGPVGDRAFCLVDVPRRQVLRTVQNPSLVAVRARWDGRVLDLVLPSGETSSAAPTPSGDRITCDYWGRVAALDLLDGPHAALVSSWLGFPVRLAAAPPGAVVYGAPVSVMSLWPSCATSRTASAGRISWARRRGCAPRWSSTPTSRTPRRRGRAGRCGWVRPRCG